MTEAPEHPVWDEPALIKALAWYVYRHETDHLASAPFTFSYAITHHDDGSYTVRGSLGEKE